mgnify:CR=1 FL=1
MDTDSSRLFSADAAYVQRLDQLSDEDFWRDAQTLARQESLSAAAREYLECELAQHRCLLPLDALSEVCLPPRQYAFLPALPWWTRGLAAWHSEVISVVDLEAYLSAHQGGRDGRDQSAPTGMLLVALHHAVPLGLYVRGIGRTRAIEPETVATVGADGQRQATASTRLCPAAAWIDPTRAALVAGTLGDAVILDLPALLTDVMDAIMITSNYPRPAWGAERLLTPTMDAMNRVPTP